MTTSRYATLCAALLAIYCTGCATTYGDRLERNYIAALVTSEVADAELEARPDFVQWSIERIEATPAPPVEDAAQQVKLSYHRFVRGVTEFAKSEKQSFLSAAIAQLFLRRGARCGMIPCNTRRCCNFCRTPC